MAAYIVGFDGKWQETFDDRESAIEWAEEVAATGRVVEVVTRRFGWHRFLTGFPESEREALAARWKIPLFSGFFGSDAGSGQHQYTPIHGGHGGGHVGGHGGHGGGH